MRKFEVRYVWRDDEGGLRWVTKEVEATDGAINPEIPEGHARRLVWIWIDEL
jgi:hypothetical protein